MRRAQKLNASRHFEHVFEALNEVQIELMIARWKSLSVYYPTLVEFLDWDVIFPSKTSISQNWYLCVKKVAERPFLECFLPLRPSRT